MATATIVSISQSSFRLTVSNITNLKTAFSPIHVVQDVPWQIKVFVNNQKAHNKSLGFSLLCATSDTTQSWSQTASISFQLIPFDGPNTVTKSVSDPQAFNCNMKSITFPSFINWSDLVNVEKHLVKDDAIQLDINIDAINPNDMNQSILVFEDTQRCCENDCLADFKLTIINIKTLMAVRSPTFMLRGLLWDLSIYKNHTSELAISLGLRMASDKVSCKIRMTTRLTTSTKNLPPVRRVDTKTVKRSQLPLMQTLVAWDKLLLTKNGFVQNDAIILLVEIKCDKPEYVGDSDRPNDAKNESTMLLKMECGICLEAIGAQNLSCPPCGHVFCSTCLTATANNLRVCPMCNIAITTAALRRIFLPM